MPMVSSAEHPQPLGAVVKALKGWVERTGAIWVEGQIIEIKRRANANWHFLTLRDQSEEISVSITAPTAVLDAAGPITEGTVVTAHVRARVWAKNGSLSFECRDLRPSGEGRLLAALEQRKRALQAEGLFAAELKRRLPFVPRVIGLVTGQNSAAERDVIKNVQLRWPAAQFDVRYALMQGPHSAQQVTEAVQALDAEPTVDVIIVARGGGALEDLLPFSDEGLVRAVAACTTPVVSAIGHEPDTPILDLVADLRASTPTDAAKRVVPDAAVEAELIEQGRRRIRQAIVARVVREQEWLTEVRSRPVLRDPSGTLTLHAERLDDLRRRLRRAVAGGVQNEQAGLTQTMARIRALSPQATLQRGYSILTTDDGRTVTSIEQVSPDDVIVARLLDGDVAAAVIDVEPHEQEVEA